MDNDKISPQIVVIAFPSRPCDDPELWDRLIEKSKDFRLNSLRESPDSFASTYNNEVTFTKDIWAKRLLSPRATHLAALLLVQDVVNGDEIDLHRSKTRVLLENDWCAMTVVMRPEEDEKLSFSRSPWKTILGDANPAEPSIARKRMPLILNGFYVPPQHRKQGIGRAILESTFEFGETMARNEGIAHAVFQVGVDDGNNDALKLYEKAGFREYAREPVQMGEKEKNGMRIPPREATVILMERVVSEV